VLVSQLAVGIYVPLDTYQAILEMSLSIQSTALVLCTHNRIQRNKRTQAPETHTNTETCRNEDKHNTTKPWFSRLLRHPARKRGGTILIPPEPGTAYWIFM